MNRRRFLEVTALGAVAGGIAACGNDGGLPGEGVALGSLSDVRSLLDAGGGRHYSPEAAAHIVHVPVEHRDALAEAWDPALAAGLELGLLALSQKCTHQGCRVTACDRSGWFECPCHGSHFTALGELRQGPATRGLDAYAIEMRDETVTVVGGPIRGLDGDVDVSGAPEPGQHCVG